MPCTHLAVKLVSLLCVQPVTCSCMQAKGSAKDLGKGLPDPSDAADQAKGLASDAKSKVKEEANVAGDVSDLPNPFDGAGGIADQVLIPLLY